MGIAQSDISDLAWCRWRRHASDLRPFSGAAASRRLSDEPPWHCGRESRGGTSPQLSIRSDPKHLAHCRDVSHDDSVPPHRDDSALQVPCATRSRPEKRVMPATWIGQLTRERSFYQVHKPVQPVRLCFVYWNAGRPSDLVSWFSHVKGTGLRLTRELLNTHASNDPESCEADRFDGSGSRRSSVHSVPGSRRKRSGKT